jgi:two-component system sensor histidine kinase ChiS
MNGLELLQIIRLIPELKKMPVIIQSGSSDTESIDKAQAFGIYAYIKKPFQKRSLLNMICNIFEEQQQITLKKLVHA